MKRVDHNLDYSEAPLIDDLLEVGGLRPLAAPSVRTMDLPHAFAEELVHLSFSQYAAGSHDLILNENGAFATFRFRNKIGLILRLYISEKNGQDLTYKVSCEAPQVGEGAGPERDNEAEAIDDIREFVGTLTKSKLRAA